MDARFRSDYPGEFVVLRTTWAGGKKSQEREWIANPIVNQHISGRAACIGSDIDRDFFNYTILARHRGGLLGSLKLQTYGVGDVAHEMRLDFAVECDPEKIEILVDNDYYKENIIYTTTRNCLRHPGEFYLIPQNPMLLNIVLPVYLAAFDGHREIFLLGYTKDTPETNQHWIEQLRDVIKAYSNTKFYGVGVPTNMPDLLLDCANFQTMPYADYIGYCDC
jgi:hypothetical protein